MPLVLRNVKGINLTHSELDNNFTHLDNNSGVLKEITRADTKVGYGLKYRLDNPAKYKEIGELSVDLSVSTEDDGRGASGKGSFTAGYNTTASGEYSTALGYYAKASGNYSTALGSSTASGKYSTSSGYKTTASGKYSTSFGYSTIASGDYSISSGAYSTATGKYSIAFGNSIASGKYSTSSGNSTASGDYSISSGDHSTASGKYSNAFGYMATASGYYSNAAGSYVTASGKHSKVSGQHAVASGDYSTSVGNESHAEGKHSWAIGEHVTAPNDYMFAFGRYNKGLDTTILEIGYGKNSTSKKNVFEVHESGIVEAPMLQIDSISQYGTGRCLITKEYLEANTAGNLVSKGAGYCLPGNIQATYKSAPGQNSIDFSRASEDYNTHSGASGDLSFARGYNVLASGYGSHAEGYMIDYNNPLEASGAYSHAEGNGTEAKGNYSHAEGKYSSSEGEGSHAEGNTTTSTGNYSHAEGIATKALNDYSHAEGKYNIGTNTHTILEVGVGVDHTHRKNGFEIYTDGRVRAPELTTTLIDNPRSLITKEYLENNVGGSSGLESITENSKTGWRLSGRDPLNYGEIGSGAIDISYSDTASTVLGATGRQSFAGGGYNQGYGTTGVIASGISSFAFGAPKHSADDGTTYLEASGAHSAAFNYGTRATGGNSFACGAESHAEGYNCFAGGGGSHANGYDSFAFGDNSRTPANKYNNFAVGGGRINEGSSSVSFGAIVYGSHSVAFNGGQVGGAGSPIDFAFASGYSTYALGNYSHAEGQRARAYKIGSFAFGYEAYASGNYSVSMGKNVVAKNEASNAIGKYNIGSSTETIHEVGIGSASGRKNAFEIYTDGRLRAPELITELIDNPRSLITKEYLENNTSEFDGNYTSLSNLPTLFDGKFSSLSFTPTTISGYGIIDAYTKTEVDSITTTSSYGIKYSVSDAAARDGLSANSDELAVVQSDRIVYKYNGSTWDSFFTLDGVHTHDYTSLSNLPTLFDGKFSSLSSTPTTISGYGITDAFDGNYTSLSNLPTLFDGNYNSLSNLPTLFDGEFGSLNNIPTTTIGYGITDVYTKTEIDAIHGAFNGTFSSLNDIPTTITGYGITDAYTKTEVDTIASSSVLGESNFDGAVGDSTFVVSGRVLTKVFVYEEGIKIRNNTFSISDNGTDTTITLTNALTSDAWVSVEY